MNTEMALEDVGESSPARPALEDALSAAKLGRDLVQQILTFSRRVPHQKAPVDIPEVIRDTVRFLRSTLPSTIEIRNELKDDRVMAYADPTQIKQVLINLGTNAGHAMKDPGGILDVSESTAVLNEQEAARISPDLAPGPYVLVEVQDTGQGMDEDTIKHIFEPFFTTKKGEGLGLGLAVAHGIVKEHQGAITVKSNRGEGTTFTVFLPVLGEKPDKGLS
jgi:signal transduction histidine kinase